MMSSAFRRRPVVLAILDGWGIGRDEPGNAIQAANTPVFDGLRASFPNTSLITSGQAVGLPDGQMGNSEVGHLNIGAGFIVYQWITRIDKAIADGSFFDNAAFNEMIDHCNDNGSTLHLMGLVGDGGVHSHSRHLIALLELAKRRWLSDVIVHVFTDGRDTAPTSGEEFVAQLEDRMSQIGVGRIGTISGRYYAMDRDKRWERTKLAYDVIVAGRGPSASSAREAIRNSYASGATDEFIMPTVISRSDEFPSRVKPGDAVIFFNFRADRARQLVEALAKPEFTGFEREPSVAGRCPMTTMTRYEVDLPVYVAFEPHDVEWPLARVISDAGMKQFHSAETEKYAHVTFFLNGGREEPFPGEERVLIPSSKVATYDLQPEMCAEAVTEAVVTAIYSQQFDFIIVNYANCDMVGHTGVFSAAVRAVETVDACLGEIVAATLNERGALVVTADHGNAEEMIDRETGGPMTAHTTNPVPIILVTTDQDPFRNITLRSGAVLSSIAPTTLELLGLPKPQSMDQPSLISKIGAEG